MKKLSLLLSIFVLTSLGLQASNPCLCEYWYSKFIATGDSIFLSPNTENIDSIMIDTCKSSPNFDKYFTNKGTLYFENTNPFYSSSFTANKIITENDIDSVNFPFTKAAIKDFLTIFGSATISAKSDVNFIVNNSFEFNIIFFEYQNIDLLDSIGNNLDTLSRPYQNAFFSRGIIKHYDGITFEKEALSYQLTNQTITFNEIFDEVTLIDLLGKSNSYKLTDKINLESLNEKFYYIVARKQNTYFKTKIILE